MRNILRYSKFLSSSNGHGGNHRTAQITELIESSGCLINEIEPVESTRIGRYINGIEFFLKNKIRFNLHREVLRSCGGQYITCKKLVNQFSGEKLLIWEATGDLTISYVAKNAGFKIIAVPHNLESLVVSQEDPFTLESLPNSFEHEVKHLMKADAVFCISREEQWLLNLYGVEADFLPYYPPNSILVELLKIRELRQFSEKKAFLILGSAINPPTRKGMVEQIEILNRISNKLDFEVNVAGYGTEELKKYCQQSNFNILGTVDSEKLSHLLASATAILAHQKAGSGALTRIPEMIIAGVPVIASAGACRSAFNYPGVYCYDSEAELLDLMSKEIGIPDILQRPVMAEKRFIDCLTTLASID